jgi:Asp-tRNA(Asn)/Glu-tRNA(Gln) amidotransferase A subunit family amidase
MLYLLTTYFTYCTGVKLKLFLWFVENRLFSNFLCNSLLRRNNFPQILGERTYICQPLFKPDTARYLLETQRRHQDSCIPQEVDGATTATAAVNALGLENSSLNPCSALELHVAYLNNAITPSDLVEALISAVEESEAMSLPLRVFIEHHPEALRAAAAESTARYAAGKPLSVLDGVPFGVKDLLDVANYPTTAGTTFLGSLRPAAGTIPGVTALLQAGAILAGKLNTHEIGLGCTGLNTTHGTPRNPHNVDYHTGGSSSGSAAAVASGLLPFAIGTDGGGSIRIPSSFCSLIGLKTTYKRVCTHPSLTITNTLSSCGPMARTVRDCALLYAMMSNNRHEEATISSLPPPISLPNLSTPSVSAAGLAAGIDWAWFEHADLEVVKTCKDAVEVLQKAGLTIKTIVIPHLDELLAGHAAIITSEMRACVGEYVASPAARKQFTKESRISLAIANGFSGGMYLNAQKVRRKLDTAMRRIFESEKIDFIITPATAMVAPKIIPASLTAGMSDVTTNLKSMRFAQLANMVGLPAISVPVGSGSSKKNKNDQLPVGLQIMAPPWQEASLFHIADVLESLFGPSAGMKPQVYWNLLEKAKQHRATAATTAAAAPAAAVQNGNS